MFKKATCVKNIILHELYNIKLQVLIFRLQDTKILIPKVASIIIVQHNSLRITDVFNISPHFLLISWLQNSWYFPYTTIIIKIGRHADNLAGVSMLMFFEPGLTASEWSSKTKVYEETTLNLNKLQKLKCFFIVTGAVTCSKT